MTLVLLVLVMAVIVLPAAALVGFVALAHRGGSVPEQVPAGDHLKVFAGHVANATGVADAHDSLPYD